ncbi:MAG TPA: class I SAM-dependent methyltransferase [Polyangiaceae bacterium]|nr:class I SAM-dependent methyltransferase [Polyangiaceae bacterium]
MSARFDEYRDTYREEVEHSIAFAGQGLDFFTEAKAAALLELARRRLGDPVQLRVLDVGCGPGETDAYLGAVGDLHGVDISEELVERARARNPGATYAHYDGGRLPYDDDVFDLAFAICVLHHVHPVDWGRFMGELVRVVRPGGLAVIVEHNPLNPLTRLAVARCAFDDDAILVGRTLVTELLRHAGAEPEEARYFLFFPWRSGPLRRLEQRLGGLPLGAQYLVASRSR